MSDSAQTNAHRAFSLARSQLMKRSHAQVEVVEMSTHRKQPKMTEYLYHKLSVLHQSLLHGVLPRSLHWGDAFELIRHLGQVEPRGDDEFAFVVGNQRELFKRSYKAEFGVEEVTRLREFLKNARLETDQIASP